MPGLNNWIKINYATTPPTLTMDLSNVQRMTKREAVDYTVGDISNRYDNLYVCLSGGIDSEFVANCLIQRGIKFTPIIVDYEFNRLEIWYAYYWCYRNNITPKVINISKKYVYEVFPSLVKKNVGSTFLSVVDLVARHSILDDCPKLITGDAQPFARILGHEDNLLDSCSSSLDINSYDFNLDKYGHPTGFISYTPELFSSIIRELDYSKPIQLAMCEYYEVMPRPKYSPSPSMISDQLLTDILKETKRKYPSYQFVIGDRNSFLKDCEEHKVIMIDGIENR